MTKKIVIGKTLSKGFSGRELPHNQINLHATKPGGKYPRLIVSEIFARLLIMIIIHSLSDCLFTRLTFQAHSPEPILLSPKIILLASHLHAEQLQRISLQVSTRMGFRIFE